MPPFRWWQLFSRSLLTLKRETADGTRTTYTVDVRHLGDMDDGEVRARLYQDGKLLSFSKLPARFPLPGGHIEVAVGSFGMKRCHWVDDNGVAVQMAPHPATAEGKRARLHRRRPGLSRAIGAATTAIVLVAVCAAVPQLIETFSRIPPLADAFGVFTAPFKLSTEANFAIGAAALLASTERALRMRTNWLDGLASE